MAEGCVRNTSPPPFKNMKPLIFVLGIVSASCSAVAGGSSSFVIYNLGNSLIPAMGYGQYYAWGTNFQSGSFSCPSIPVGGFGLVTFTPPLIPGHTLFAIDYFGLWGDGSSVLSNSSGNYSALFKSEKLTSVPIVSFSAIHAKVRQKDGSYKSKVVGFAHQ